ncbi:MAG TPA: hypothetical protein VFP96_12365 [Candidatus Acidoferrum sp.]|nr:hypothetical protein [Candidatus Acidoferrum sp.]
MQTKRLFIGLAAAVAIAIGGYLAYAQWTAKHARSRESLLRQLPVTATYVLYADVAQMREGTLLKNLAALNSNVTVEPEYKQFVAETNFDYEKDLDQVGIAVENVGNTSHYFVLADGRFDRKRIETYLRNNATIQRKGGLEVFFLARENSSPYISSVQNWVLIAFLSDQRIALTTSPDLNAKLDSGRSEAGHQEWMERFERLSGSPAFVLLRQDAAIGSVLSQRTPAGIASPQLAQVLNQLTWVSIAGRPEGSSFRAVIDGECPNELVMRQLLEFFNGITLLAEAGLNDPKLRQKMDPAEREAYLQLLNSIDVTKLDRGNSKSVRLSLLITPEIWSKLSIPERTGQQSDSNPSAGTQPPPKNKNAGAKAPAGHH